MLKLGKSKRTIAMSAATLALAGGATIGLGAVPASATVYNNSCPSGGAYVVSYHAPTYCYSWDGTFGGNNNTGWMNLPNTDAVCSRGNSGYAVDSAQHRYYFTKGDGCTLTGGAWLQYIVFTG